MTDSRAHYLATTPLGFSDLPTEIWLLIALYIPKSQLFQLKSLNGFFLNCWMDCSWREITISSGYPKSERILRRMLDPFVATRTRQLIVDPSCSPSNTSLSTFFRTITSVSIARTIQELSLRGFANQFTWLGEYSAHTTPFENLTKLRLLLIGTSQAQDSTLPLDPFIRSLPRTLQHLSIENLTFTLDFSSLFNALSQSDFPKLRSLDLALSWDKSSQPFLQSLRRFLLTHANNLQKLSWAFFTNTDEKCLDAWLADSVSNDNFQCSSLQTLSIYSTTTQAGLSTVLTLIKRTAPTLSELCIPVHVLTFEEAKQMVDALTEYTTTEDGPRNLKSLDLIMTGLSVPFLDLLACKLPRLEKLSLKVFDSNQSEFCNHLHHRWYIPGISPSPPAQDHLHTWKLRDFRITKFGGEFMIAGMQAVAAAVPSVVLHVEE